MMKQQTKCKECRSKIHPAGRGRPARYCSPSCRQRAFEKRKLLKAVGSSLRALNEDLADLEFRRRVVQVLASVGLIEGSVRTKAMKLKLIKGGLDKPSSDT